jgi:hypothetical protein
MSEYLQQFSDAEENLELDFKGQIDLESASGKTKLLDDVVAFLNQRGGGFCTEHWTRRENSSHGRR